jgi:hypothetical protein
MKRLLPYLLLLPLLCSQPGLAFQAPDDFRGIHWGDPVSGVKGMAAVDDAVPVRYYHRAGDPLKLGAATLKTLRYGFYRDKFYSVLMEFEGAANFDKVRDHLLASYGEAARVTGQSLQWGDPKGFFIRLKYSDVTHQGYVFYVNRKIAPLP